MNLGHSGWRKKKQKPKRKNPEGYEDIKAIAVHSKDADGFKTSMRMAFAEQTQNSTVG